MRSRAYEDGLHSRKPLLLNKIALAIVLVLAFAIGLASLRYLSGNPEFAPPSMQASFIANERIFVTHASASALALMAGAFQLLARPRRRWPVLHRWNGRLYVFCCLAGGLSALWIAPDIESGWIATAGFSALAIAWIGATFQGWRHAVNRRFDWHRRWMLRSFALTAAAITLRLQLVTFEAFGLDYAEVSNVLSLSCWLPNILVVELVLLRENRRQARVSTLHPRKA